MDNIIQFPSRKPAPSNLEEVDLLMNNVRSQHVNESLITIVPMLFSYLDTAGFDFTALNDENVSDLEDPMVKDGAFIVESIRSLLCKYHGIHHPFQEIAENIFEKDSSNESLKLAKKIDITFKKGNSES